MAETPDARAPGARFESSVRSTMILAMALVAAVWGAALVVGWQAQVPLGVGLFTLSALALSTAGGWLGGAAATRRQLKASSHEMAAQAEALMNGAADTRLQGGPSPELRRLAESVNRMADHMIQQQDALRENVRSLNETNRDLALARRELIETEKMATVGRVASGIAHEIGNPLGSILGYVEVARRRGEASPDWVDGVAQEARRIDRVIRGLLDFARPGPSTRREVPIGRTIESVVELLDGQGHLGGIDLRTSVEPDLPDASGDPTHLEQILINLVLNARAAIDDANRAGRIEVRALTADFAPTRPHAPERRAEDPRGIDYSHLRSHRQRPSAEDRFAPGERVVRIEVADNGIGIAPEHLERVLEPFFTTREPGHGTGLGLALAARMAEAMSGALSVESEPDVGSCFTLVLPFHVDESEPQLRAE